MIEMEKRKEHEGQREEERSLIEQAERYERERTKKKELKEKNFLNIKD